MTIQQHKFIEQNIKLIRHLTRMGFISPKLLTYYDIFLEYQKIKNKSRINRYSQVAKIKRQSVSTVRRAVYEMKKYVQV